MLFYWADVRHRRVAVRNLSRCFGGEKTAAEIRDLARENFRRIGENYCCAVKSAAMAHDEVSEVVQFVGFDGLAECEGRPVSRIFAIGHFGNFELYARVGEFVGQFQAATTYRGLRHRGLNGLLLSLRERNGALFFERRREGAALREALSERPLLVGLLADQHAGGRGMWLPFFGHFCSTSPAPAVYALRYKLPLHTAICFRTGLARWRIEMGEEIPTSEDCKPRAVEAIMLDVNRAFERAIRRDPANWFWVHNRWKPLHHPARIAPGPHRVPDSHGRGRARSRPQS